MEASDEEDSDDDEEDDDDEDDEDGSDDEMVDDEQPMVEEVKNAKLDLDQIFLGTNSSLCLAKATTRSQTKARHARRFR